jgi:hypothetical protein
MAFFPKEFSLPVSVTRMAPHAMISTCLLDLA